MDDNNTRNYDQAVSASRVNGPAGRIDFSKLKPPPGASPIEIPEPGDGGELIDGFAVVLVRQSYRRFVPYGTVTDPKLVRAVAAIVMAEGFGPPEPPAPPSLERFFNDED